MFKWHFLYGLLAILLLNLLPTKAQDFVRTRHIITSKDSLEWLDLENKFNFSLLETSSPYLSADPELDFELWQNFITPVDGGVSEKCQQDSRKYIEILNSPTALPSGNGWAYKMFDASAKVPPSSLLQGAVKKIGAFESCLEVAAETFKGKHCMVTLAPTTYDFDDNGEEAAAPPVTPSRGFLLFMNVAFGRCIPDSCSEQDLSASMSYFMKNMTGYDATLYVSSCHSQDEEIPYTAADWSFISICVIFGLLIFTGTMIDISIKYLKAGFFNKRLVQIFQGFSFYRNTLKIFSTDVRKDSLTSINGIRFLSMTWVLFGHAFGAFQGQIPTTNGMVMFDKDGPIWGSLAFQAMEQAYPSVDTFFMIGACVLTYSTLKQLDKQNGGNLKFWIMFYVHRYLRLTAVYAMVIFFTATLWKHFATGPQSSYVDYDVSSCQKSWWINLLYVNNFQLQWDEYSSHFCIGQGWYLANDMQFFIISPIFIFALWYNKLIGMVLCAAGVIVSTVVPTWLAYANEYPISISFAGANFEFFTKYYVVPWCRFQPYIVGIILGYILHRMRDQPKLKLNPYFSIWIWGIAGAIGASVIYGLYPYAAGYVDIGILDPTYEVAPRTVSAFYNGFHRLAWSVCVAWVVLACTKGAGGTITSILSWPFWIPLANLSYCIYLVHLSIINYMASLFTFSVTYTHILGVYFVLGILSFSIFVAFIFAVIFELPIAHLERLAFASIGIGSFPDIKKD